MSFPIRFRMSFALAAALATPALAQPAPPVPPAATAPPARIVFSDTFRQSLDTGTWHSGYYRYNSPVDQSRAVANGELNRYSPDMAVVAGGALHLRMGPETPQARADYMAAVMAVKGKADTQLAGERAALARNTNPDLVTKMQDRITRAEGKAGLFQGDRWNRLTGTTWRSGLVASNRPMVRKGQMITFAVSRLPGVKGGWPALWLYDPLRNLELDVIEGNWERKIVGHRHVGWGMKSAATSVVDAPPGAFKVSLWLDGETLRWFIDGKPWGAMPIGAGRVGQYNVYMNYAMGSPRWAFIGMPDRTTPPQSEFVVTGVWITEP